MEQRHTSKHTKKQITQFLSVLWKANHLLPYWVGFISYPFSILVSFYFQVNTRAYQTSTNSHPLEIVSLTIKVLQFPICMLKEKSLFLFYYLISVLNDNFQCLTFQYRCKTKGKRRGTWRDWWMPIAPQPPQNKALYCSFCSTSRHGLFSPRLPEPFSMVADLKAKFLFFFPFSSSQQ